MRVRDGISLLALGLAVGLAPALLAGCQREFERGEAGESCTRRDDCADGLRCVAQVCVSPDAGSGRRDAGSSADAAPELSCDARSDCEPGYTCEDNRCLPASAGVDPSARYGRRGESCRAKNDCAGELACVAGVCRAVEIPLGVTAKQCARVECADDEECCADFTPDPECDTYRENCETDPIFCSTYRSLCECTEVCEDELCVASAPGCSDDGECTSQQTPYCVEGRCAQCREDTDCPGSGTTCDQGVCASACTVDENCPLMHACNEGKCEEVGCQSDRECAFVTRDPRSTCSEDGECRTACVSDADCGSEGETFQVCEQGRCMFVGCETDTECRAFLRIESESGTPAQAVCR